VRGLGPQLAAVKRASLPLQHHLELPISLHEKRHHAARLLPPPMYVLFTQLAAGAVTACSFSSWHFKLALSVGFGIESKLL